MGELVLNKVLFIVLQRVLTSSWMALTPGIGCPSL